MKKNDRLRVTKENRDEIDQDIYFHILSGREEAPVSAREISEAMGFPYGNDTTGPQIRAAIHRLRVAGHSICSNKHGYWLGRSAREVMGTATSIWRRIRAIARAVRALENQAKKFTDSEQYAAGSLFDELETQDVHRR